jgi:CRISPR/Cas system-associated endonuclease Cas1
MVHKKVLKLKLEGNGSYLGRGEGCFIIKHKNGDTEQYPLFTKEIGEAELRDHNSVSTGALISLAQWDIETIITDFNGLPVAILKNLNDDSHVKTRVSQYEVSKNNKGIGIAKQIVLSKIEGQNRARAHCLIRQVQLGKDGMVC